MAIDYLQYPRRMPNPSADDYLGGGEAFSSYGGSTAPASEGFDWKSLIMPAAGMMSGPVGAGLAVGGLALQGYGQYKQAQEARRQYKQAVRAWEAEQERQAQEVAEGQRQTGLSNALTYGRYSKDLMRDAADRYGSYARQFGLTGRS